MSAETHSTDPIVQLEPTADFTGLDLPSYAQPGDAGADLRTTVHVILHPGERAIVPTGLKIALPAGFVGLIHPRSGLAAKHGLTVVNSPGTIDAGYRGELMVILLNTDKEHSIELGRGDRIAQLVIQRVETAAFEVVDKLDETVRGEGGLGSTGGYSLPAPADDPVVAPGRIVEDSHEAALTNVTPVVENAPFTELPVVAQAQRLVEGFGDTGFLGDRTRQILEDGLTLALTGYDPATVKDEQSRDNCREDLFDVVYQWLSLTQVIAPAEAPRALTPLDAIRTAQASPAAAAAFSRLYPAGAGADLYAAAINRVSAALDNDTIRATIFQVAGASAWPTEAAPTA